jgi:methionyl-tRNA synthetase
MESKDLRPISSKAIIQNRWSNKELSRPKNKINWGVPVPDDEEQVIYIWIDALSNYITILGFPESNDFKNFWPAHTQVLGKGVMRFHAAIWPAMLLGLNLPLPNNLFVHGYVISNNKKMSKTLNNVIYPEDIIQIFGQDAYRYFFFKHISSYDDGNFSWHKMYDSYTTELSNELGNLVSRTINMCSKYGLHLTFDEISQLPNRHDMLQFHESMLEYNFPKALESVWELVRGANKFIESTKPWQIAKDPADQDHLKDILISLVTDLKQIAFYLEPFTPNCANQINYVLRNYNNDEFLIPQLFPKIELPGELSIS